MIKELLRYALREIRRRKNKSIVNITGYVIAVAFLVITLSFAGFSWTRTNSALQYTGAQLIGFVYATSHEDAGVRFKNPDHEGFFVFNNPIGLFPLAMVEQIRQSPHVRNAAPLLIFSMITDVYVNRSWVIAGFDPTDMESIRMVGCSSTEIVDGRLIESDDHGVVLLEQTFADAEQYNIGDIIYLGDEEFRVLGILSPGTRPAKADIYLRLEEAIGVLNTRIEQPVKDVINTVLVDGTSALLMRNAMNDVKEILGFNSSTIGYGCFNPAGAAIGITMRGMKLLGLIVFLSILLLILASQYYSVVERGNDIGLLKAIGWSDSNVLFQVVAESIIQSFIGALAGCLAAVLLVVLFPVGQWMGLDESLLSSLSLTLFLSAFLFTVLAGALAGVVSAIMSVRLKPADILRRL